MNYAMVDQPLFETGIDDTKHYEYRAGRWWVCAEDNCDGVHHYYSRVHL